MLTNTKDLKGMPIHALDGDLGKVDQVYFDDETWTVRYLTVRTGSWLEDRQVLISPVSVLHIDWETRRVDVSLTKQQVAKSPDIDTKKPVSRQHESSYLAYYGYPDYWGGPYLWGPGAYPMGLSVPAGDWSGMAESRMRDQTGDSHLRSAEAVTGYRIDATDGEIGHVDGFVMEDKTWAIRYMEVATRNWWPGKKVLVSPEWIESVSWDEAKVSVRLTREAIQTAPEYEDGVPISRDYENGLYVHYDQPPYWLRRETAQSKASMVGVL